MPAPRLAFTLELIISLQIAGVLQMMVAAWKDLEGLLRPPWNIVLREVVTVWDLFMFGLEVMDVPTGTMLIMMGMPILDTQLPWRL